MLKTVPENTFTFFKSDIGIASGNINNYYKSKSKVRNIPEKQRQRKIENCRHRKNNEKVRV